MIQLTIDGVDVTVEQAERVRRGNPLIPIFGEGPPGARCGSCRHLFAWGDTARRYLKCDLRRNTRGPGTDHRARWPACGKYEEER